MEEKLEKVLHSLESEKDFLFDNADKQVLKSIEKEKNQISEAEKRVKKICSHTESIAYLIASLVYDTLFDVTKKKGEIKKVDTKLGVLSEGTNDTELSHYLIDENGLTIYLNYSNEYYTSETGHGRCFLDSDKEIDFDYLLSILENNGIILNRRKERVVSSQGSGLDVDILSITYLRREKEEIRNNSRR